MRNHVSHALHASVKTQEADGFEIESEKYFFLTVRKNNFVLVSLDDSV